MKVYWGIIDPKDNSLFTDGVFISERNCIHFIHRELQSKLANKFSRHSQGYSDIRKLTTKELLIIYYNKCLEEGYNLKDEFLDKLIRLEIKQVEIKVL